MCTKLMIKIRTQYHQHELFQLNESKKAPFKSAPVKSALTYSHFLVDYSEIGQIIEKVQLFLYEFARWLDDFCHNISGVTSFIVGKYDLNLDISLVIISKPTTAA